MKQYQYKVELMKKINGEYQVVKTEYVWEYDDDCTTTNVFYDALEVFKDDYKENDVIRTHTGLTTAIMKKLEDNEPHYIVVG